MAEFEVPVVRVSKVENHPNADRLSLVYFRGFPVVSAKNEDGTHRYQAGDFVVYVPENAVVPEYLLRQGFWNADKNCGMLAGPDGNRVKPVKLRGVVSQGIMFPLTARINDHMDIGDIVTVGEGENMAQALGITKFEPPIPANMAGEVFNHGRLVKFDVENVKKFPDVLQVGERVVVTEKMHGTMFGIVGDIDTLEIYCFSKGLGQQGLAFKNNEVNLKSNLYVRTLTPYFERLRYWMEVLKKNNSCQQIFIFGEIFGKGVQDLHYGTDKPEVCIFDTAYRQNNGEIIWQSWADIESWARNSLEIETAPVLYIGPYNEDVHKLKDEPSTRGGIREGVVIKPTVPRSTEDGRVIFKDISDAYLTRKNGTELN